MNLKIYTDGGSRGNPGPAACAFIVYDEKGEVLHKEGKYLGVATNNVAEYSAVVEALSYINNLGNLSAVTFYLDSLLVVSQLNGLWKVKDSNIRNLIIKVRELEESLRTLYNIHSTNYIHIPRLKNKTADLLVNQTLDSVGKN